MGLIAHRDTGSNPTLCHFPIPLPISALHLISSSHSSHPFLCIPPALSHTHTPTHTHTHTHQHTHTHMHTHAQTRTDTQTHTRTHAHTCADTQNYTHTQRHLLWLVFLCSPGITTIPEPILFSFFLSFNPT